jgi:hypothetical protein
VHLFVLGTKLQDDSARAPGQQPVDYFCFHGPMNSCQVDNFVQNQNESVVRL